MFGFKEIRFGWFVRGAADAKRHKDRHFIFCAIADITSAFPGIPGEAEPDRLVSGPALTPLALHSERAVGPLVSEHKVGVHIGFYKTT